MKGSMKKKLSAVCAALLASALLCACGGSYTYTTGDVDWYSTYSKDEKIIKDDWFSDRPEKDNEELALASMQLTASAVTGDENGTGAAFLKSMGFEETGSSDFASTDPDDFNYIWGRKTALQPIGLYRSDDMGATWTRINDDLHQFGGPGNAHIVSGDMNEYGRVYMSTVGRGVVTGRLVSEEEASIEAVNDAHPTSGVKGIYDLQGRYHASLQQLRGIYIVNGKKFWKDCSH